MKKLRGIIVDLRKRLIDKDTQFTIQIVQLQNKIVSLQKQTNEIVSLDKQTNTIVSMNKQTKNHNNSHIESLCDIDFDWTNDDFDTNVIPDKQSDKIEKPKQPDTNDDNPRKRKQKVQPVRIAKRRMPR